MFHFDTLEEYGEAFLDANQEETAAMFKQGDILVAACHPDRLLKWGMTGEDVVKQIGQITKRGRATLKARKRVSEMFPADLAIPSLFPHGVRDVPKDIFWTHYLYAAETWSPEHPAAPFEWLHLAVVNGLSARRLKLEIRSATGKPTETRAIYFLDAEACEVAEWTEASVTLRFLGPYSPPVSEYGEVLWPQPGDLLAVTAARQPASDEVPPVREPELAEV